MLTNEQKEFWSENGFLVLERHYSEAQIDTLAGLLQRVWRECPDDVVIDVLKSGRRCHMSDLTRREKRSRLFKVNDLFLKYQEMRELCLEPQIAAALEELIGEPPVLINTLNLERGSQQANHVDSLYMTPITVGKLAATWIALEDVHPDAGPLRYIPGSHRIPPFIFSNGGRHTVNEEMVEWRGYIARHIREMGLREETFCPKKGDVFIWHSELLHGGSPIANLKRTRNSIVCHFWGKTDCMTLGPEVAPLGNAYWLNREPQHVVKVEQPSLARRVRGRIGRYVPSSVRHGIRKLTTSASM